METKKKGFRHIQQQQFNGKKSQKNNNFNNNKINIKNRARKKTKKPQTANIVNSNEAFFSFSVAFIIKTIN